LDCLGLWTEDWGASTLQVNPTSALINCVANAKVEGSNPASSIIPLQQAGMARDDMARDDMARDDMARDDMARAGSKASVACNKASLSFTIEQDSADDKNMTGLQAVRGKKTKVAKAKAKYADQDEEDRELAMQFLGAAGKSQATVLVNVDITK